MKNKKGIRNCILTCVVVLATVFAVALPVNAISATITVPDDHPTIQGAVNAAGSGYTVFVRAGTYYENVSIAKTLTLQGEDRDTTVINGGGSDVVNIRARNVTVRGFTITNGYYGIYTISGSNYSNIQDCEIFGNDRGGLRANWADRTVVSNNEVHDNEGAGIHLDSMRNSIVENNFIFSNFSGIYVGFAAYNNIVRNNIIENHVRGIHVGSDIVITGNKVYHNDIIGNDYQHLDNNGFTSWDDGYPSGGNYWSDYAGLDDFSGVNQDVPGSDGIGDTPYEIIRYDGFRTYDYYPQMSPLNTPNEPPVANARGPYLVAVNFSILLDGSGSDPDGDALKFSWAATAGSFDDATLEGPTYTAGTEAGIFELTLEVTDPGDLSDSDKTFVVVYDPEGGFVTGGGWIDSPTGAYTADLTLTGKANFGFVSKYKKGATIPTGNTEFQFKAGDLNFHSSSYDWLVITGSNYAKFKGLGTINEEGDYRFMLWAGDNDPDTFRIKIWEEDDLGYETVIYDNGSNQEIGGGSIKVHTK